MDKIETFNHIKANEMLEYLDSIALESISELMDMIKVANKNKLEEIRKTLIMQLIAARETIGEMIDIFSTEEELKKRTITFSPENSMDLNDEIVNNENQ